MARPLKWALDLDAIRERIERSKTETWTRRDLEHFVNVGRANSSSLSKAS